MTPASGVADVGGTVEAAVQQLAAARLSQDVTAAEGALSTIVTRASESPPEGLSEQLCYVGALCDIPGLRSDALELLVAASARVSPGLERARLLNQAAILSMHSVADRRWLSLLSEGIREMDPGDEFHGVLMTNLANAYLSQGDIEKAAATLQLIPPSAPGVSATVAMLEFMLGDRKVSERALLGTLAEHLSRESEIMLRGLGDRDIAALSAASNAARLSFWVSLRDRDYSSAREQLARLEKCALLSRLVVLDDDVQGASIENAWSLAQLEFAAAIEDVPQLRRAGVALHQARRRTESALGGDSPRMQMIDYNLALLDVLALKLDEAASRRREARALSRLRGWATSVRDSLEVGHPEGVLASLRCSDLERDFGRRTEDAQWVYRAETSARQAIRSAETYSARAGLGTSGFIAGEQHRYQASWGDTGRASRAVIRETVTRFGAHQDDTGRPQVQIALLTRRIAGISQHLQAHPHDHAAAYGLRKVIGQRKAQLNYLKKRDVEAYRQVLKDLQIRG